MDSSKSTEDDTIRDPMESGDVATRPRGTRARDTWKVNVRNLVAEDKRVLDYFQRVTAARGSNSFLFPNLLPNGSFEFPAPSAAFLAFGWYQGSAPAAALPVSLATAGLEDGLQALCFGTTAGQVLTANQSVVAEVDSNARPISFMPASSPPKVRWPAPPHCGDRRLCSPMTPTATNPL
jgi:hypothetical protein